jgi:predicted nuclease with TOPRIM domain
MSDQAPKDTQEIIEQEKNASKRTLLVTIVVMVLVTIIAFLVIQKIGLERKNQEKEAALDKAFIQLDSLSNELDDRILTISKLGGEIDTLLTIKTRLEEEKKQLLNKEERNKQTISGLRDKVEGYQELLLIKDEEIKQLTAINEQLLSENSGLKVETQELNQSIRDINKEKEQLQEKVALVSRLKVEGMTVYAVKDGRERPDEFRNRHIDNLKIVFTVGQNLVAPIEGKELLLRIVAPDGNVLFDVTRGSGTFMFEGREQFFTAKKEILFDRSAQTVTVTYDKGSEFATGLHQVEVYTDEYLMGKGTFIVK